MILDQKFRVFLAVAREGSFSRAAWRLGLSQSSVSFHVGALEKELGLKLFERRGRSIALTLEGRALLEEGEKLARRAQHLEERFSRDSALIPRRLRLGSDSLTCAFTLPRALARFRETHPDLVFSYEHLDPDSLVDGLLSGILDVALMGLPPRHKKLMVEPCFQDEIVLVFQAGRVEPEIGPGDLEKLPLLVARGDPGLELLLRKGLEEAGAPLRRLQVFMEIEGLAVVKNFILAGLGGAFLPRVTVQRELDSGEMAVTRVKGLRLERQTRLVHAREGAPSEAVSSFLEFVRGGGVGEVVKERAGRNGRIPRDRKGMEE